MDIYAVTGKPVAHSLSPQLFNSAFLKEGIEAVYARMGADSAGEALETARQIGLRGMNVTSPFKEEMAGYIDIMDSEARDIGAVNGVVFSGGRTFGFNTDSRGVADAFKLNGILLRGKRAAVLGTGGAGRAAVHALVKAGAKVTIVNRTFSKAVALARRFGGQPESLDRLSDFVGNMDVVLSAVSTVDPLVRPEWLVPGQVILDANYRNSRLCEIARQRGCRVVSGIDWLLCQAVSAFEFFTGRPIDAEVMKAGLSAGATWKRNGPGISLVGMMGAGKTTVGKMLASLMDLELIDTDKIIEKEAGASISEIFRNRGEEYFRQLETRILERMPSERQRKIYALGGGAVIHPENRKIIQSRSVVIWLWADPERILERITAADRPLLDGPDKRRKLSDLMSSRLDGYVRASDLIINANRPAEDTIRKIIDEIH